jgi:hypothetical protein
MLTPEEMQDLNQATLRELHIESQQQKTIHSIATWMLSHPECPADPASVEKITSYAVKKGWNPGNEGVLNQAYADLLSTRQLTQNFTQANRDQHERNVDELRRVGYDIRPIPQAPEGDGWNNIDGKSDLETWRREVEQTNQPAATMEEAFLIDEIPDSAEVNVSDIW